MHYEGAGEWLVGGQGGQLAFYKEGVMSRVAGPGQKAILSAVHSTAGRLGLKGGMPRRRRSSLTVEIASRFRLASS